MLGHEYGDLFVTITNEPIRKPQPALILKRLTFNFQNSSKKGNRFLILFSLLLMLLIKCFPCIPFCVETTFPFKRFLPGNLKFHSLETFSNAFNGTGEVECY